MNELPNLALSALATVVSGYLLFVIKSHRVAEEKYRDEIKAELDKLGCKDDELGTDIQVTRGAVDWLCGTLGKERPNYGRFR